jgi:hypothetical protein
MSDSILVDGDALKRGVADALSLYVGPGRRFSREMMASATGQEVRTVKGHCLGEVVPGLGAMFAYLRVLPVEFAEHVLSFAGLGGVRRLEADNDARRVMAEVAEGLSVLAGAMADGHIDHTERPKVIKELREAAVAAEGFAADLERVGR